MQNSPLLTHYFLGAPPIDTHREWTISIQRRFGFPSPSRQPLHPRPHAPSHLSPRCQNFPPSLSLPRMPLPVRNPAPPIGKPPSLDARSAKLPTFLSRAASANALD